jgi:acyl-CoA synthetase (AMP-forming)/AMP-acid ligase II
VEHVFVAGGNLEQLKQSTGPVPSAQIDARQDVAVLPYSSGTTGKPKGVMLTHYNIVANAYQMFASDTWVPNDIAVNVMPFYHAGAMNALVNPGLALGLTIVVMERFDLERWLEMNQKYSGTWLLMPPPVVLAITKSPLWDRFKLDRIRKAGSGAAPLGADGQQAFEERTGVLLGQVWGMTEASAAITVTPPDRTKRKFGGAGYLLSSMEARVVDLATSTNLGPGEQGEIWVRGPSVMKGYWNNPAASADCLVEDGWLRTGDLGYFDEDGCVFLVDRLKELIKYKALQVAPAELEDVVQSHPAVLDAAVIGVPAGEVGEIPKAYVVLREGASLNADELMAFVAARVAPHKKVRDVEFIDTIPKSPSGKILRRLLKERARAAGN